MHDHLAMIDLRVQELIPNPVQILWILQVHGNAWLYSRVDEQKISTSETVAETLQEQFVFAGKELNQRSSNRGWCFHFGSCAWNNAVRRKRLKTAEL